MVRKRSLQINVTHSGSIISELSINKTPCTIDVEQGVF
jgi:hypothetical protein